MSAQVDKKIHDLRLYLGLSHKAFGDAIGYTGSHIIRIERKVVNPSEQLIHKICEELHVDPEYFNGEVPVDQAVQKMDVDTAGAGHRLSIARQEKGLSMWELSRKSGISQPQISFLESGKYQLKRKAGEKLAAALEVGVDWLLTGNEERKQYPADKALVNWLWQHPEIREELWKRMKEESD